jgi:acyl-CoA dehydrogenase
MTLKNLRRNFLSRPLFKFAKRALPSLSETERQALTAGDVWWDRDLFSGNPDWQKLLSTPPAVLSEEEQAFLNGPVKELCRMLDEWEINQTRKDLSREVWEYLKQEKFFAMIIPKQYGGLEFSAYANSEVIRTITSRSLVAAVTVMVPNSLGPAELLMLFGTKAQQDHWLPRLADGRELPGFALTSSEAGSDAAAMIDSGTVCKRTVDGEEILGIELNWSKRYITLSPVATVLGLAFKLYDPDHLLGEEEERGITVALVPTDLPGVETGRRHIPAFQMFLNGPTEGKDVFISFDHIIGGQDQIGKGWPMLMSALAAGRGVSLPSLSASATALCARTTGAYARIRKQFKIPIGKFEGIQERLGPLAANAYLLDAARRLTCAGLDQGHNLSVISAIMKVHATYMMRDSVDHAMDVHAGKSIIDGPNNYLADTYRAVPVGITVEGANILTRSMIIFGQGAIRCHPWILKEMMALEENDPQKALEDFDESFWGHVAHSTKTFFRAWGASWSFGLIGPAPAEGSMRPYYRQLSRYAAAFAVMADAALLLLGGGLKRKEMLSARFGDILSELYFLSAVLKRWKDDGHPEADLPLVHYNLRRGLATIEQRMDAIIRNLPVRPAAWLLRFFLLPFGVRQAGPSDKLIQSCADLLLEPSEVRDRLTAGLFLEAGANNSIAELEQAFTLTCELQPLTERIRDAHCSGIEDALEKGLITDDEAEQLKEAQNLVARVIAVDDFPVEELGELNYSTNPDAETDEEQ